MTEWDAKVQAAITRLQADVSQFPEQLTLGLVDRIAASGAITRMELLAHGSPYFVQVVLGQVTLAVHGGGRVPKHGGWYRIKPGQPYVIDPDFSAAWIRARQATPSRLGRQG